MTKDSFPPSRILSTSVLLRQMAESDRYKRRFCFILGSGASVESGIPTGNQLEMRWMNCIMGEADDRGTLKMNPEESRRSGKVLEQDELLRHPFEKIEQAWKKAKADNTSIDSKYYFDIYTLRFYPDPTLGYRYMERIMENIDPSVGYQTLALLLTEKDFRHNLVITTNFDSLVEDALFLYTDKKPLVVSHESLAGFIQPDVQRPIVAKVHRGLFFAPLNTQDDTSKLDPKWEEALQGLFRIYTPIVIGYGGGDESLMCFLEKIETKMPNGIYWCYRGELPDDRVLELVQDKKGYLVEISGFDDLMLSIGEARYGEAIIPSATEKRMEDRLAQRIKIYNEQWGKLRPNPVVNALNEAERKSMEKREEEEKLTPWDYIRQAREKGKQKDYSGAVELLNKGLERYPEDADLFFERGYWYGEWGKPEQAVLDYNKAIALKPDDAIAYNNRGNCFSDMGEHDKALADFDKAIELSPDDAFAYNNRGNTLRHLKRYSEAIESLTKAISLNPDYKNAYLNRAAAYRAIGKTDLAEQDEKTAAGLPDLD